MKKSKINNSIYLSIKELENNFNIKISKKMKKPLNKLNKILKKYV